MKEFSSKLLKIIFITYLGIYLIFKSVNEVSNNSIEYFANLNEVLFLVLVTGISYYIARYTIFKNHSKHELNEVIKLEKEAKSGVSIFLAFLITAFVHLKTDLWGDTLFLIVSIFVFSAFTIYYSLNEEE